ncbi:MAG TPA: hypothetical protein VMH27_17675 [Puia sp.]|nr:hypothetical protein [Puia sp.]
MKKLVLLSICFVAFACSKSNKSKGGGGNTSALHTTYTASVNVGGKVYNTSNYSDYSNVTSNYQWDGLNLYFGLPACSAHLVGDYYQVSVWDTASGAMTSQPLLQFNAPNQNNFEDYNSPTAYINFLDSAYAGTASVSASITSSGKHTGNGSFTLQGVVVSLYSGDSLAFTASVNFTNALSY